MKSKHADRIPEYLQHIIGAIDRALGYVSAMQFSAFEKDTRTQDAVIRSLEIVGEAANKVRTADPDFAASSADVPWDAMYGMRCTGCETGSSTTISKLISRLSGRPYKKTYPCYGAK
jgi:uncharacterized protein with HEPN domain